MDSVHPFEVVETTIETIHAAFRSGHLSARQLVQAYLDRIEAYDKQGPALNAIISLNPGALKDADRLDALFKTSGSVGSLHGIPVVMKDQGDVKGLPTTMGPVDQKGAPHLNTFLVFVPSVVVPAGFTGDKLPAGITFLGRPYDDANMIKLAYAYEQATRHRRAPATTPALARHPAMA